MSTRRHRIVHRTIMRYEEDVVASHNELRMIPINEPGQTTVEARVRVRPHSFSHHYTDHWGTEVMAVEVQVAHRVLEIEASSIVERSDTPAEVQTSGWDALQDEGTSDLLSEYLNIGPRSQPPADLEEIARQAREEPTPRAAARFVVERVHERMEYAKGATKVFENASDAWERGKGVCQDFAHITIGALRSIGVPTRYVSGYVAQQSDLQRGEECAGESHAWIEIWDGAWLPHDPTNLSQVDLDYVVVGRGRNYDDVAPFRGMYAGPELSELNVEITVTRVS